RRRLLYFKFCWLGSEHNSGTRDWWLRRWGHERKHGGSTADGRLGGLGLGLATLAGLRQEQLTGEFDLESYLGARSGGASKFVAGVTKWISSDGRSRELRDLLNEPGKITGPLKFDLYNVIYIFMVLLITLT
ncbi:hypothetical protein L917_21223, partial [Phytophthora nicotianae]